MSLPFTHKQFLDVFGAYNSALWPAAVGLWLLTAAAIILLATGRTASRSVAALLALHWLWSGAVYHLGYFSIINPAARAFGVLFVLEAVFLLWFGVVRGWLVFAWGRSPRQVLSVFLCLYALAYPLLAFAIGMGWPRLPTFGVPCPTALLTVGLLLTVEPGHLRGLGIIPLIWTAVGGSAAFVLDMRPDLMLPAAGVVLFVYLLAPRLLSPTRTA